MIVSTFIVQASFTILTYDRQNMFIIQATDVNEKMKVDIFFAESDIEQHLSLSMA